jgi:hypothetical protein
MPACGFRICTSGTCTTSPQIISDWPRESTT